MGRSKAKPLDVERARAYVHSAIFEVGGLREECAGLIHKTIPTLLNHGTSLTVGRALALLLRLLFLVAAALYPIVVKTAFVSPPPSTPPTLAGAMSALLHLVANLGPLDWALGFLAVMLLAVPKAFEVWGRRTKAEPHSPYHYLSAALKLMPHGAELPPHEQNEAIRLTLTALRVEMSKLTLDDPASPGTEVSLIEFCNAQGTKMQVRTRTSQEATGRPARSEEFMAFYVASEGRALAEHDFCQKANPFPPRRLGIHGSRKVWYRSILFMPITSATRVKAGNGDDEDSVVIDRCVGVICVAHPKPYRFWRWGDHKIAEGGFSDVAYSRSVPYIALIERLLGASAHGIRLEVK